VLPFILGLRLIIFYEIQDLDLKGINKRTCLEIRRPCSTPFVMLTCYKPPNSVPSFFVKIEKKLGRIGSEDKEIFLAGDLNCNFLSSNKNDIILIIITLLLGPLPRHINCLNVSKYRLVCLIQVHH